jgi:hypothetical protein
MPPSSPIPADLADVCHLAMGEYDSFGVVFFQHTPHAFQHQDPQMGFVQMVGISKEKATTVEEALKYLPRGAGRLGDTFYARQKSGDYFRVTAIGTKEARITPVFQSFTFNLQEHETACQLAMAKGAIRATGFRQEIEALKLLVQKTASKSPAPLFDLSRPEFVWLLIYPEDPHLLLLSAMKGWPEKEIQAFFHNPRDFGHDPTLPRLERFALSMDPRHVPAIVQAGILPKADSAMERSHPRTQEAFRLEERKLLKALGSPEAVETLLIHRQADKPTKELPAMEARVAKARASAPAIPRISQIPTAGSIPSTSAQISR